MAKKRVERRRANAGTRQSVVPPPRVVVKFRDHVNLPYRDGVESLFNKLRLGPWDQLRREFAGIRFFRMYTSVSEQGIRDLVARAADTDPSYRPPNLLTYFVVDCPPGINPAALARALSAWPAVETAYIEGGPTPPPVNAADDPRSSNQGYLNTAPDGIDARYAWMFSGGDGASIGLVDMETGWTLNHEDLPVPPITILSGVNKDFWGHGTSVLGVILAVDNTIGDVGIVPQVAARVVSQWRTASIYNTADAILSAIGALTFGDVLLLEAHVGMPYMPVEVELAVFDMIRLGTALGIVIVEAGGNGRVDLDTVPDLNRSSTSFKDSGALMVGAASSATPHSRIWNSNFGSRIDCYAWGENIDTTGDGWNGNLTNAYTSTFGGTSGASGIITGAAVALQGLVQVSRGYRFSPLQVRAILSDPLNGTASTTPASDRIGVMPDLRRIITNVLSIAPDVYIRDFVGDVGDPHTGAVSASPDIILRTSAEANPQGAFGEGSGTENSSTLGSEAQSGQDNFIYARLRNRGGSAAANVTATVYWSPPASLVTPNLWTLVGSVVLPSVPTGNVLTVSGALIWPAASIPATGHYCFVGLIGTATDPAPGPADFLIWDNFIRFIRENNNVTWRNFNVVNNAPPPGSSPPGYVALPFLVSGAPDRARRMQLEVVARLPEGARAQFEAPLHLLSAIGRQSPYVKFDRKAERATLPINPHGPDVIGEAALPAKSTAQCRLLVQIPKAMQHSEYEVFVRQVYEKEEVGRITWRLVPPTRRTGYRNGATGRSRSERASRS